LRSAGATFYFMTNDIEGTPLSVRLERDRRVVTRGKDGFEGVTIEVTIIGLYAREKYVTSF
jgi:hypothetical protein